MKNNNDFYCPIALKKILEIGEYFNKKYFKYANLSDHQTYGLLVCIHGSLYSELNAIICNMYILNSKKNVTYRSIFHNNNSRIYMILKKGKYKFPLLVNRLKFGLKENKLKRKLKSLRFRFIKKFPTPGSIKLVNLKNDIVCTNIGELIYKNAESTKKEIFYIPMIEWFRPIKENFFFMSQTKLNEIFQFIENLILEIFKKYKLKNNYIENYIKELILNFLVHSNKYIGDILENKTFPMKLWTGTGGPVTTKILRFTTILNNGYVVGHDHSHGQGSFRNSVNSILELPFVNEFVTRTKYQKQSIEKDISKSYLKYKNLNIKVLNNTDMILLKKIKKKDKNKKILFVSALCNNDIGHLDPLPFIPCKLDFELRLFYFLKNIGLDPVYKPHPESRINLTSLFLSNGYRVSNEKFEDIFEDMQAIIFSEPNQTSFFNALKTDIPIIIVDSGFKKWDKYALKLLKKRVGYVKTYFNQNNRILFKEKELLNKIKLSSRLNNQEYVQKYFYPKLSAK